MNKVLNLLAEVTEAAQADEAYYSSQLAEKHARIEELEEGQRAGSGAECRAFHHSDTVAGIDKLGCYYYASNSKERVATSPDYVLKVAESQLRVEKAKVTQLENECLRLETEIKKLTKSEAELPPEVKEVLNTLRAKRFHEGGMSKVETTLLNWFEANFSKTEQIARELESVASDIVAYGVGQHVQKLREIATRIRTKK